MSVVDAIGWIAALSSASLAVPQGVRIAVTRSVAGVSTVTWQTMLVAGVAWTCHGLLTGIAQILWPNLLLAITSGWVLGQLCRARHLPPLQTWAVPAVVVALASGADLAWGPVAFAAVVFVPGAIGQLTQLLQIRRAIDPAGVSMVGLVMNLTNQLLWFCYALPAREIAVLCVCIPMGVLVAASVVALQYRRSRPLPRPAVAPAAR